MITGSSEVATGMPKLCAIGVGWIPPRSTVSSLRAGQAARSLQSRHQGGFAARELGFVQQLHVELDCGDSIASVRCECGAAVRVPCGGASAVRTAIPRRCAEVAGLRAGGPAVLRGRAHRAATAAIADRRRLAPGADSVPEPHRCGSVRISDAGSHGSRVVEAGPDTVVPRRSTARVRDAMAFHRRTTGGHLRVARFAVSWCARRRLIRGLSAGVGDRHSPPGPRLCSYAGLKTLLVIGE